MYEEIMRNSRNPFFALLNIVFPEHMQRAENDFVEYSYNSINGKNHLTSSKENEWMQEYHIIYNSYILEDTDTERT